ncbi:MAG: YegS/Rv2252/BmrU family lipid kinase [Clostridiales Family XIII bacterium]|jgi:YegS/Rv2252/BmrU family lipid kinase|nr:YegS/Rv2252/BmrU family lipid kinase [Clostridiales Family XIII bacterium]
MNIKKILLYYNPYAGNGVISNNLDKVIEAFQHAGMLAIALRADDRDALDKLFTEADINTYAKIMVAGGDGTINTLVNAMIRHDVYVPLAVFPSGTANDLAHYFDLPMGIEEFLKIATSEHYTHMDVGVANDRCFVNVLAMGMMVDVSQKTDPAVKNTMGIMAYYLRGMAEITKLRPIPIKLTTPDEKIVTKMYAMLIMNGRSAGGFKRVAPTAEINDGLLDVIVFQEMPVVNLGPLLFSVLTGQHTENEKVISFRTNQLKIESSVEIVTDVDGEAGDALPLDVKVLPRRLKINTLKDDMDGNVW